MFCTLKQFKINTTMMNFLKQQKRSIARSVDSRLKNRGMFYSWFEECPTIKVRRDDPTK